MSDGNHSSLGLPQFKVLSSAGCQDLYLAALECLERVGVLVNNAEARRLLAGAGARLEGNLARIPARVIEEAIKAAPREFTLWGREESQPVHIAAGEVHFGPGPTCSNFIDPFTRERRRARRGDAGMAAKVSQALDNIDFVMSLSLLDDVTPVLSPVYEYAEMVANTTKPIVAWANNPATVSDIYQMAVAVAGDEDSLRRHPRFALFACYESPLRHPDDPVANLLWAAERGVPVVYLGGPTVGLESPVTGASALMIYLATALSGLAIVELKRPGAPVVLGGVPSAMDLRTARPAYGSPEMSLYTAGAAQVTSYLGLPFMGTAGASESKLLDGQAAGEVALQVLLSALSGASLVHDVGFLDCADIGSLALLVATNEIIGMAKRIQRGIDVRPETLMLDLVQRVGPGGNFIAEEESSTLCRAEIWAPELMDRNPFAAWDQMGRRSLDDRAQERLF